MKRRLLDQPLNRRDFLRWSLRAAAGGASLTSTIGALQALGISAAHAQSTDYKALVCVFLYGGNDAFNMLVPIDLNGYLTYTNSRGTLATTLADLTPITPVSSDGHTYGMHNSLAELRTRFQNNTLAFVANTGPLLRPTLKADYQARRNLPPQLFSHNDQQDHWHSGHPDGPKRTGWGGRIADLIHSRNENPQLSMNISLFGTNLFETGDSVVPYIVDAGGVKPFRALDEPAEAARLAAVRNLLGQTAGSHPFEQHQGSVVTRALDLGADMQAALAAAPPLTTAFPNTYLARQLKMVAQLISARSSLKMSRQIFFVAAGGYDTHDVQLAAQPKLWRELSQAMSAFYDATTELGLADSVTTFTASDFGRTLTSNGDGSDHGWGSHHMVMGGAVRGRDIYGAMPDLAKNSSDDGGGGRMIPTLALDQYGATLARWFGVPDVDLDTVLFPNLGHFPSRDVGFMV